MTLSGLEACSVVRMAGKPVLFVAVPDVLRRAGHGSAVRAMWAAAALGGYAALRDGGMRVRVF